MLNWLYDCYSILNKVYSDGSFIKQAIASTPIEEKNRALTVKTCYGVLDKDGELSYYLKVLTEKTPKLAIRTILKISMYAIKYLGKHDYAITENAVELTKKLGKKGASGFVNAVIRKFVKTQFNFPNDVEENLSIKYSYPRFAVKELLDEYGKERTEKILSSNPPDTCLSFYDIDGEEYLSARGVQFDKTPFDGVYTAKNFVRNSDYDDGVYTYQAVGSVAICEMVGGGGKLLDCCSAPGGKAVRLSHKFDSVTAFDIHEHRVELIRSYANRMGVQNVNATVKDASEYDGALDSAFDVVLCDAPCSGLGVVFDNPDIKLRKEKSTVDELNQVQLRIISTVSKYVKVGGYLCYSTCSVLPRENIGVVREFLNQNKNFSIVPTDSPLAHENVDGTVQFLPDISLGGGFYFAKLKRE